MKRIIATFMLFGLFALILSVRVSPASASTNCQFSISGTTMTLQANCTTDAAIVIPAGYTLNGAGRTITAVDPVGGHFKGAVVQNGGSTAHVTRLTITASGLANVCDALDDRLTAIRFDNASGSISRSIIRGFNQGPSGCQEGFGILLRGAGMVEVKYNIITNYQKAGIVVLSNVIANIHHNDIGASATQYQLAANAVEIDTASVVKYNTISGNQWFGASDYGATAILTFGDGTTVSHNFVRGNSDVGIYIIGSNGTYTNNLVIDQGVDGPHGDFGIADISPGGNRVKHNSVYGFDVPYYFEVQTLRATSRGVPAPNKTH